MGTLILYYSAGTIIESISYRFILVRAIILSILRSQSQILKINGRILSPVIVVAHTCGLLRPLFFGAANE